MLKRAVVTASVRVQRRLLPRSVPRAVHWTPLRHFSNGSIDKKERKKKKPADQYVNPTGKEFYHDELKSFLLLEDPNELELKTARDQIVDAITTMLHSDILGQEATVLALAAGKIADPDLVLDVYRSFRKEQVQPPPIVLEVTAKFCTIAVNDPNAWNTVLDVIDEMHDAVHLMGPSLEIYENAIDTCVHAGKWIVALRLIDEMQRYNLVPTSDAWLCVAKGCIVANEHTALDKLWKSMESADLEYELDDIYRQAFNLAIDHGNAAVAHAILLRLHQWNQPTTTLRAVNVFWKALAGSTTSTIEPLELTPEQQQRTIDVFAAGQLWVALHQWLPLFGYTEYKPYKTDAYATSAHYMKVAFGIFDFLQKDERMNLSPVFYDALLQGCGRHQMLEEATKLLREHPSATASSYYYAITACGDNHREALKLYEAYVEEYHVDGKHQSSDIAHALLTSFIKAKEYQRVLQFATTLPEQSSRDPRIMAACMSASRHLGAWSTVIDIFKQVKVAGIECTPFMYADALHAYANDGQIETSLRLHQHIQSLSTRLSYHPVIVNALFYCCSKFPGSMDVAMDAFTKLLRDADGASTPLQYQGVLDLLDTIIHDKAASHIKKLNAVNQIWSTVMRSPSIYTAKDKSTPAHILNKALLIAAHASAYDEAETMVIEAEEVNIEFNAVTYQTMMKLYSQSSDLSPQGLQKVPPPYPIRFEYWWDQFQVHNCRPTCHTIEPLLTAHLRGIPVYLKAARRPFQLNDAWEMIESHGIPMTSNMAELFLRLYSLEEQDTAWENAQHVMNAMYDANASHTSRSIECFTRVAMATPDAATRRERLEQMISFLEVQQQDLWWAVALALPDTSLVLFLWQEYHSRYGHTMHGSILVDGLLRSLHASTSDELRQLWHYLGSINAESNVILTDVPLQQITRRLHEWKEDMNDKAWTSLLDRSVNERSIHNETLEHFLRIETRSSMDDMGIDRKIVILGCTDTGKTSLTIRYCHNNFATPTAATIGASFLQKRILLDKHKMTLQIWDTAGQERFKSMASMYYRNAKAAILVFDVTKQDTFDKVKEWLSELRKHVDNDIVLALVGNKCDLPTNFNFTLAEAYAKEIGATAHRTSAQSGQGVVEMFETVSRRLLKQYLENEQGASTPQQRTDPLDKINVVPPPQKPKQRACPGCNLDHVEFNQGEYIITPASDPSTKSSTTTWFYFSIATTTSQDKGDLSLRVINLIKHVALYENDMRPVYRILPSKRKWERIRQNVSYSTQEDFSIAFTVPAPSKDQVLYIAFTYPYSYGDLQKSLKKVDAIMHALEKRVYYHRETLVHSVDGRNVDLLTISSHTNILEEREASIAHLYPDQSTRPFAFQKKKTIVITARVHPAETPSSYVVDGILNFLCKDDPRAIKLLDEFVFKIIPMLNPDGVARGCYRHDSLGVNLNRYYESPSLEYQPTIFATKAMFLALYQGECPPAMYIDLHAHAAKRGCFIYGNCMETIDAQVKTQLYPKLVGLNSSHFEYDQCNFSEENMKMVEKRDQGLSKQGCARVALYNATKGVDTQFYTVECNYNMGRNPGHIPATGNLSSRKPSAPLSPEVSRKTYLTKYTPLVWEDIGKGLMVAILDFYNINPYSRIPQSSWRTISGITQVIRQEITAASIRKSSTPVKTLKKTPRRSNNQESNAEGIVMPALVSSTSKPTLLRKIESTTLVRKGSFSTRLKKPSL